MAEDAISRARAIAARLAGSVGSVSGAPGGSELGKRKNRFDDEPSSGPGPYSGAGLGAFLKKKVYVPQNPEVNYMGLIIGPRGSTQKDLEQRTGAKILFRGRGAHKEGHVPSGHPDDDDNLHIAVEGPHDAVQRAVTELEDILNNPERASRLKQEQLRNLAEMNSANSIYGPGHGGVSSSESRELNGESVIELKVPNHLVGYVIGKGGENIQKMQAQTGGHVQIAKESEMKPGETMRTVTLRGSAGGVQELKRRVEELVAERARPTGISQTARPAQPQNKEQDHAFILKVAVPNDKVGLVIGKGGVTIKAIQDRTFCNVLIPPNADEDNLSVRTLSIGGDSREAVEACQMEIFMTLQQHQQQQVQQQMQAAATAPSVMYMTVPDDKVGIIIGKGGTTIKELQQKYGCRIQIPTAADPGSYPPVRTITISGPVDGQYQTRAEVENIVAGHGMGGRDRRGRDQNNNSRGDYYGPVSDSMGGYGAVANTAGSAGYYGASQVPAAASYAGGYGATIDAYAAASAATAAAAAITAQDASGYIDPTSYYPDFWNYASMYGEEAARAYYTTWSPPVGTPPPPGIVLPAAAPSATAPVSSDATVSANSGVSADAQTAAASAPSSDAAATATDMSPEAVAAAWELYNKQYAEWMQSQQAYGSVPPADPAAPPSST